MNVLILLLVLAVPPKVEWTHFDKFSNRINDDTLYADIINHSPSYQYVNDMMTTAHENLHIIHNYFINKYKIGTIGLYGENGKIAIIQEPAVRTAHSHEYIPKTLRYSRFNIYLYSEGQPLDAVFDEWVCYYLDGCVGIELIENETHDGRWTDGMMGGLELGIYSIGLAMAVADKDPEYFENHTQFKAFLAHGLKRTFEMFNKGRHLAEFKYDKQEKLYNKFTKGKSGLLMRHFLRKTFGMGWVRVNLGF